MSVYEIISLFLESCVVIILVAEYVYDYRLNTHVKSLKKRTKRNFDFEELTQGEHK